MILLSGGRSSRMGRPKGLLEHAGKPLLPYHLDAYRSSGGRRAVVVLGFDFEAYLNAFPGILDLSRKTYRGSLEITTVVNAQPEFGPFSSVQAGLRVFLQEKHDFYFVQAIDKPVLESDSWNRLSGNIKQASMAYFNDNAHPYLISNEFANHISGLDPSAHRMDFLRDGLDSSKRVVLESASESFNLNTPEDFERFTKTVPPQTPVLIGIVGKKRSGKTTHLQKLVEELRQKGVSVGGILQPASDGSSMPEHYGIEDIKTKERRIIAYQKKTPEGIVFGFNEESFAFAREKILDAARTCDVVFIDEFGRLESKGEGHFPAFTESLKDASALAYVISVREDVLETIKTNLKFDINIICHCEKR